MVIKAEREGFPWKIKKSFYQLKKVEEISGRREFKLLRDEWTEGFNPYS